MQRKLFENPKIVLLNVELELKSEKENAELRIDNVEVNKEVGIIEHSHTHTLSLSPLFRSQEYQKVVDAEWTILYNKLEKIVNSGAKVVLSKLPIGDVATQYFADR